jgi:hypothetical protein
MNTPHAKHLKELKGFFADSVVCRDSYWLLVHLATRLAAAGHGSKVLAMVERSPERAMFEALANGIRIYLGMNVEKDEPGYEHALEIAERIGEEVAA